MTTSTKRISLGLQGGGSLGAFGWGVLDRLLQETGLEIAAISGTSAGSVNAAVLADGYACGGGSEAARAALERFWYGLSTMASMVSPTRPSPVDWATGGGTLATSPGYQLMQLFAGILAPPVSPLSMNPMIPLLSTLINFERVRACEEVELYVPATNIRSGTGRIFTRGELDARMIAASSCLPYVFAPVVIDGESYWDGSFVGNPSLSPLVERGPADIVIIQNNPIARPGLPMTMSDIMSRTSEIAFNISFVRDVSEIRHLGGVINVEDSDSTHSADVRLHLISANEELQKLHLSSKFNTELPFLLHLRELEAATADGWLKQNLDHIGKVSTINPVLVHEANLLNVASL
ncbi:patatin-like phospholipase family protein [Massilia sp. 9096]|uniref:patatin-like phospholipase family protein n=1 Tax=Massilia sp. 9096 TaxID=1500894 RepID=UPI0009DCE1E0|nr:patatin-like phospholipase family protein [Massilia sp. 9096]